MPRRHPHLNRESLAVGRCRRHGEDYRRRFAFLREFSGFSLRARRSKAFAAEIAEKTGLSQYFREPGFNRFSQFPQAPFEEMIGALNDHQLPWLGKCLNDGFKFRERTKLIAVAAYEQLGLHAALEKFKIIDSIVDCADWQTKPDDCLHARVGTSRAQPHRGTKRKSGQDQRQVKFAIEPVECSADVLDFTVAVVVFAQA